MRPSRATQVDVRRPGIVEHQRVEPDRPGLVGDGQRRGADEADRPGADRARRVAIVDLAQRDELLALRGQRLEPDLPMLGVERGGDHPAGLAPDERGGAGSERGDADGRDPGRERDRAGRADADAQAGIAARPDGDGDAVERGEAALDRVHHALDQRHQRLGMAALHRDLLAARAASASPASSTQAEQAPSAVSIARMRIRS